MTQATATTTTCHILEYSLLSVLQLATHGRKGHLLKTVIKCDRQRAFADFSGCVAQPRLTPYPTSVPCPASAPTPTPAPDSQLQVHIFDSDSASSQKSCKSPAALHVFHAQIVTRLVTRTPIYIFVSVSVYICSCICIFVSCCCSCIFSCVCIGTCVRASSSSSSSTWPLAAITISCGKRRDRRRCCHILDFMFATFCDGNILC